MINKTIQEVTERVIERSKTSRKQYLDNISSAFDKGIKRGHLSCGNLAHSFAGCNSSEKEKLKDNETPNIGIITAYNDMLSAHKPYEHYPQLIRDTSKKYGCVAQVASGVPAMCDGVTQGQKGMELSLYSRDVIALSSAVGLSHNVFDGSIFLGICDKIVPGLMMSALKFGHLPTVFLPGGPMPSGISNEEKARIRQDFAEGKIGREELLKGESDSYHSPGTCTFYGTANSNQMLMEIMGMQLPGSSFVNPNTKMRDKLNDYAIKILSENIRSGELTATPSQIISEKSIVNGIIGLLATGGSTNLTIHLIAIAKSAGIIINWDDFSDLSKVIPSITKVYPNGAADVNHFHAAGGMSFVIHTLLENGLLHEDVNTILGSGLEKYTQEPKIQNDEIVYVEGAKESLNDKILRPATNPFSPTGGIQVMDGNLGRSVVKVSAVKVENRVIEAPAIVFNEQDDLITAFKADELNKDFIAVFPFQGPKQNGMPELHKLTPTLTILQKRGLNVGLITDGRMSGASGKIASAIHLTPEASEGGPISKIKTGDMIQLNCNTGELNIIDVNLTDRTSNTKDKTTFGLGTELFGTIREQITSSEEGASFIV